MENMLEKHTKAHPLSVILQSCYMLSYCNINFKHKLRFNEKIIKKVLTNGTSFTILSHYSTIPNSKGRLHNGKKYD